MKGSRLILSVITVIIVLIVFGVSMASDSITQEDFFVLCANASPEEVQQAIDLIQDIHARDEDGQTALMGAAMSNENPEVIQVLLEAGADVHARDEDGRTALMRAAGNNENPEVIQVLLEAGADPKAKNKGETAFDCIQRNEALKNTDVYWRLHDAQFD